FVNGAQQSRPRFRSGRFDRNALFHDVLDRPVPVSYWNKSRSTQVDVLKIVGTGLAVPVRARVLQSAVLIGMGDQRAALGSSAVKRQALRIGSRRCVGKSQRVLYVETRAIAPDHACVTP